MDAWWRLRSRGDGWYWMIRGARHGDLYHMCSLAPAFAAAHGRDLPIYLVADRPGQAAVASLFSEHFAEIIVDDSFSDVREDWEQLVAEENLPWFGPNAPLFLHPTKVLDPTRMTVSFAQENGLTWIQIYKNILRLPGGSEPASPTPRLDVATRARALCREAGIEGGRSVILFPFAQSLPVNGLDHFAVLAQDFAKDGLRVFTSVAGDEVPVAGTTPVSIPFDLLLDVAEHAGRIVAVRSGICDITSSARCRKTYIYPSMSELRPWAMSALGYAHDAHEIAFDFAGGDGTLFSTMVRTGPGFTTLAAPPRHLSAFVGTHPGAASVQAVSMTDALGGAELISAGPELALVIHGVAPRQHGRLRSSMAQLFAALVRRYGERACFYACRDDSLLDFFEQIEGDDLAIGRYHASRYWHTAIITVGAPLQNFLPSSAREKVLDADPGRAGDRVRPGEALGGTDALAAIVRTRPLAVKGVQFLGGWSTLEPWGIWSDDQRATLKIVIAEPLAAAGELWLGVEPTSFGSGAFQSVDMRVNDESVAVTFEQVDGDIRARIPLPPGRCVFYVHIVFHGLQSPFEAGTGTDRRLLGLGVFEAKVVAASAQRENDVVGSEAGGMEP